MKNENYQGKKSKAIVFLFVLAEISILFLLFSYMSPFASGGIGENVTVSTYLNVGETAPVITNISVDEGADSVTLIANDTEEVVCTGVVMDWNNDTDVTNASAEFFDNTASSYGDTDDNNYHYTNDSCEIIYDFGSWNGIEDDNYTALINCTFDVWYYSNAEDWNCTMESRDSTDLTDRNSDNITISQLLAVGLPEAINYGTVNATYVSDENITNVTNFGNVELNLSLSGYAREEGDGYAMNCSLGFNKNISIDYEKYNLTSSVAGPLSLSEFDNSYINLSSSPVVNEFNLNYRHNDTVNKAKNETYWRMYVPEGVGGTCQGNIVFGATRANA